MIENEIIINANYDFDKIAYVPIQFHKRTGFSHITYSNIELRWPNNHEMTLIAQWFKNEDVYRAFGFSRPPSQANIENSVLPDLTARERYLEAVEFLVVRDHSRDKAIGFFVVFESHRRADPNQEIDFAVVDENYRGQVGLLRKIELCILSYLFAVRGAQSVFWIRRKPRIAEASGSVAPGEGKNRFAPYQQKGKPFIITRQQFKRRLERRRKVRGEKAFPFIVLMKSSLN
ncbi:MAG: hypothetical protein ONB46_10655 [candidate division KSB1 bacterium]|nr:hypothetical protein [candidate division KSB1 bacterium]MDZ7366265.1 hypothetical protein [candidate division KSB1 bacterium]MDZ7404483.1 hypothetical protein [candidate division KSB1 bacterium]